MLGRMAAALVRVIRMGGTVGDGLAPSPPRRPLPAHSPESSRRSWARKFRGSRRSSRRTGPPSGDGVLSVGLSGDPDARASSARLGEISALSRSILEEERSLLRALSYWCPLPEIHPRPIHEKRCRTALSEQCPLAEPIAPTPPDRDGVERMVLDDPAFSSHRGLFARVLSLFSASRRSRLEREVAARMVRASEEYARASESHALRLAEHARAVEKWRESRVASLGMVRRLLDSPDAECVLEAACGILSAASPPFASEVTVMASAPECLFVLVDLPGLDAVVPLERRSVDRRGNEAREGRPDLERNGLYAGLVLGHCLSVACRLQASLPCLERVTLSARAPVSSPRAPVRLAHVLEMVADRGILSSVTAARPSSLEELLDCLKMLSPKMRMRADGSFAAVAKPRWLSRLRPKPGGVAS